MTTYMNKTTAYVSEKTQRPRYVTPVFVMAETCAKLQRPVRSPHVLVQRGLPLHDGLDLAAELGITLCHKPSTDTAGKSLINILRLKIRTKSSELRHQNR